MRFSQFILFVFLFLLVACGETAESAPIAPESTLTPQQAQGKTVFTQNCGSCHSLQADTIIVGPSLAGIAVRAGNQVEGQDAQSYLMTSILRPGDHLVEGFENVMPENLGKKLTGEEIDAVIAYLMTVK